MSDHVARMTAEWSPGRAVAPPDQGLAPRAETTTGVGEPWTGTGQQGEPVVVPASAVSRGLTRDEAEAYAEILDAEFSERLVPEKPPCAVCGDGPHPGYVAPAPPAEAKGEDDGISLLAEYAPGGYLTLGDVARISPSGKVAKAFAALHALRTRAREAEERAERVIAHCDGLATAVANTLRERDEARRLIAGVQPDDRSALAVNILRVWPRAEIKTFARHLLGDSREQESLLLGQLQQQLEIVRRERDEAREQRDAASARAEEAEGELRAAKNELLAAVEHHANARKVIDAILPNEWPDGVSCWQAAVDAFNAQRAARLRAEAEVKRLNDVVDGHARDSARAGLERDRAEHRLKLATEEIVRVRLAYDDPSLDATDGAHPAWWRGNDAGVAGAVRIVTEALDEALPLAGCVGGADLERVRQRIAALRERCKALESDRASLLERWVTKADAPAAKEGK